MAVVSQLEYRFNLFTDTVIQPTLTAVVEVALWTAIFTGAGLASLGGLPKEYYLSYALWAAFFARATSTWMYEFRMVEEIDTGSVNTVLARPISFYEYYLSQFLGYKLLTTGISLLVPIAVFAAMPSTTDFRRLPLAVALMVFYFLLTHTISFCVASFAFFFNRIHAFTVAKNISLWMLTGELFPLDLVPEPFRAWMLKLPFASAVYVPVGYLTGRIGPDLVWQGFVSVAAGLAVFGLIARVLWMSGRRRYSGTGA